MIQDLILKPVITEKATAGERMGKYMFFVRKHATKIDIAQAFKQLYGVKPTKVNVMRTAEKMKSGKNRMQIVKKHEFKKVIITAKSKKPIDLMKPVLK